jgi:HEAT repeats
MPGSEGRYLDILFCDGCDGSISKRDVDVGNVVEVGGRSFHRKCVPGRGKRLLGLLAWLLLLPAVAGGILIGTVLQGSTPSGAEGAEERPAEALGLRLDDLEAEVRGLSAQLQTTLGVIEGRMGKAERGLGRLDDGLGVIGQDLDRLVAALERVALNVVKIGTAREAPANQPAGAERAELATLLELARSADRGERFGALFLLAIRPEEKAVLAVRKALTDPDDRVRAYAAELLGRRGDKTSAGLLVAMLRDEIGTVRDAAHRALLLISGMPFEFNAVAPDEKREEQARNWEKWWADHDAAQDPDED